MTKLQQTLWDATKTGQYPPGTTVHDLTNAKDKTGYSALHHAARTEHLPPDTTIALLKTTKDNNGTSAWDSLCNYLNYNPTYALDHPPHLFQEDSEFAIATAQNAINKNPGLQNQAAIWLGQILAGATNQHNRTIPTP